MPLVKKAGNTPAPKLRGKSAIGANIHPSSAAGRSASKEALNRYVAEEVPPKQQHGGEIRRNLGAYSYKVFRPIAR
jgi:hypothetical protein